MSATTPRAGHSERRDRTRVWRIRLWIRLVTVPLAPSGLLILAAPTFDHSPQLAEIARGIVLVLAPYSSWWPRATLDDSGGLDLRGWFSHRQAKVTGIADMQMTGFGLKLLLSTTSPFTIVIFPSTAFRDEPRSFDFVEAVTGQRPHLDFSNSRNVLFWRLNEDQSIGASVTSPSMVNRRASFAELADSVRQRVAKSAVVSGDDSDELPVLIIQPEQADAAGVWIVADDLMDVQIGDSAARWELPWSNLSRTQLRAMIEAVITVKVSETFALRRVAVSLLVDDDGTTSATVYQNLWILVPQPGWRRWGCRKRIELCGQ